MVVCNLSSYHMGIDLKTVKHISKLSRISVDDEKAKKLEADLNSIFSFIEKLNELNTEKIEPLTSIAETNLQLRKDEIKSSNIREQILKNSPEENKEFVNICIISLFFITYALLGIINSYLGNTPHTIHSPLTNFKFSLGIILCIFIFCTIYIFDVI